MVSLSHNSPSDILSSLTCAFSHFSVNVSGLEEKFFTIIEEQFILFINITIKIFSFTFQPTFIFVFSLVLFVGCLPCCNKSPKISVIVYYMRYFTPSTFLTLTGHTPSWKAFSFGRSGALLGKEKKPLAVIKPPTKSVVMTYLGLWELYSHI
jgi:hypothetical protein